jgi:hypothetical protein
MHGDEKHAHSVSCLHPLLYSFGRHGGYPVKQMSILLENRPEFAWHRKRYAAIRNLGENGLQILLPGFGGTLPPRCTKSRFARVKNQLVLRT